MMRTATVGCVLMAAALASAQDAEQLKIRVGLLPGDWRELWRIGGSVQGDEGTVLQLRLKKAMEDTGRYEVVEITDEQLRRTAEIAREQGAVVESRLALLADVFIDPTVIKAEARQDTVGGGALGGVLGRLGGGGRLNTKTVEIGMRFEVQPGPDAAPTETVEVFAEKSDTAITSVWSRDVPYTRLGDSEWGRAFEAVVDDLAKQVPAKFEKARWGAVVAAVEPSGQVVLGRGENSGIAVGMEFDVVTRTDPVLNPITGEVIDPGQETIVGRIRVVRVTPQAAFCEDLTDSGIGVLMMARVPKPVE